MRRPVILSNDSEKDSVAVGMGGRSCGGAMVEGPATSSGCSSTERPSSVESDMRGISSPGLSLSESLDLERFSAGRGNGIDEKEDLVGEADECLCEPCVLLLNLDGSAWLCDMVLFRFEEP